MVNSKLFSAFALLLAASVASASVNLSVADLPYPAEPQARIVPAGTGGLGPADFTTTPGVAVNGINHDGVGDMLTSTPSGGFRSSASLLSTGRHILTAAHSVTDDRAGIDVLSGTVRFDTPGGASSYAFTRTDINVHPSWNGDISDGFDVAVVDLGVSVDPIVPQYDIFTGATIDILDRAHTKIGYGRSGVGATGATQASGTKRFGENHYEFTLGDTAGTVILYDFDNGIAENDAFGTIAPDRVDPGVTLGRGDNEAIAAPGDSGGPTFVQLDSEDPNSIVLAGVTSFGLSVETDVDATTNSSFGEIAGDTSTTAVADFITAATTPVPEPAGAGLLMAYLIFCTTNAIRRPKSACQAIQTTRMGSFRIRKTKRRQQLCLSCKR